MSDGFEPAQAATEVTIRCTIDWQTYPINQSTVSRRYSGNLSSLPDCLRVHHSNINRRNAALTPPRCCRSEVQGRSSGVHVPRSTTDTGTGRSVFDTAYYYCDDDDSGCGGGGGGSSDDDSSGSGGGGDRMVDDQMHIAINSIGAETTTEWIDIY